VRLWREHVRRASKHLLLLLVEGGVAAAYYFDGEDVVLLPGYRVLPRVFWAVILGFLPVRVVLPRRTAAAPATSRDVLDALLASLVAAELLLAASPIRTLDRPYVPAHILDLREPRLAAIFAARIGSLHPTLVLIPILLHFLRKVVIGEVVPILPSHLHVILHLVISLHCH
jgi:hypothetical protein